MFHDDCWNQADEELYSRGRRQLPVSGTEIWKALSWALLAVVVPLIPASAELTVSQLIVELRPSAATADIEIANDSRERTYIAIEPREIISPGLAAERPFVSPDPETLGLIASPTRMVLEPRQRRTMRLAAIGSDLPRERVYRVTIKPVAGEVTSEQSGLKLLVGYDLLVLVRPKRPVLALVAKRDQHQLTLVNNGNASVELSEGKLCNNNGTPCRPLPSKRLYAGASWTQPFTAAAIGEYRVRSADGWSSLKF
jgi:P pilus assembly chaperone PapD